MLTKAAISWSKTVVLWNITNYNNHFLFNIFRMQFIPVIELFIISSIISIQQGCIKLINSDSKDIYHFTIYFKWMLYFWTY